jgi:cytochrome c553
MKTFILLTGALLILGGIGGFWPTPPVLADDCAKLFVSLTCHTCHGPEGKGMVRTETKEKYYLKKKKMYRQMITEGVPVEIVKKLKPLYKKKFIDKEKFIIEIESLIGKDDTDKYQDIIIGIGGRIYYHKGDLIPGFEDYPRHAGNKKLYLYRQMKDILESRRTNGNSEAMRGIQPYIESNKITDEDFMCIAEYLSNVKVME